MSACRLNPCALTQPGDWDVSGLVRRNAGSFQVSTFGTPGGGREAVGAGRRVQGRQGGIGVVQIRDLGVFFRERALASQHLQEARDDPRENGLQLFGGRGRDGLKDGSVVRKLIDAIEHQTMEVNIEIGRGAKALDEGHGAGLGLLACQPDFRL